MSLFELNDASRKRKQADCWSDYLYSTPNSPSSNNNPLETSSTPLFPEANLDFSLDHNDCFSSEYQPSQTQSRRHSVATGDMNYLSSFLHGEPSDWDPQQLLMATAAYSSGSFTHHYLPHRRAMSTQMEQHLPTSFFFDTFETDKVQRALSLDATTLLSNTMNHSSSSGSSSSISSNSQCDSVGAMMDLLKQPPGIDTPSLPTASPSDVWTVNALDVTSATPPKKRQRRTKSLVSATPTSPTLTLSTISPSPPITPVQALNPGLDSGPFHIQKLDSISTNFSMVQCADTAAALKLLVQKYLLGQTAGERTVVIQTSKVAQKSYGTEKRFLCPPPTTFLKGANWWTSYAKGGDGDDDASSKQQQQKMMLMSFKPPKLSIQISGELNTYQQAGVLEWTTTSGGILDNTSAPAAAAGNTITLGKCVSKQLHIADADEKRKRVEVMVNLQLGNGIIFGTLPSKSIKVISKPSKKRQSVKNMELCIHHGTTISLFNRIRSQTVSTKYLGVRNERDQTGSDACFVARTGTWDPFVIWAVDPKRTAESRVNHPSQPDQPPPPSVALPPSTDMIIQYNQTVVLQCVSTGLVSPIMVIRKVDKGSFALGGCRIDGSHGGGEAGDESLGDPVSQLHKVAFQIVQDPTVQRAPLSVSACMNGQQAWSLPQTTAPVTYLSCMNDAVGLHRTTSLRSLVDVPSYQTVKRPRSGSDTKLNARRRTSSCTVLQDRQENAADAVNSSDCLEGACWSEDITDAAVWTIVGTHSASYTFWTAPTPTEGLNAPFCSSGYHALTPFPVLSDFRKDDTTCTLKGENFTQDLDVWFGDLKSGQTECKNGQFMTCVIPDVQALYSSPVSTLSEEGTKRTLPILLVRKDGVVYRTNKVYSF